MKKIVLVISGTRADYGLLRSTLKEIHKSPELELQLLVTGMHLLFQYGQTVNEIYADNLPVTYQVQIKSRNDMLGWLIEEIQGIKSICLKHKPNIILVLGDRDEALAGAIVGAHLGISVAHIHGGDITGTVTVDDKIRDAITSFSNLHFPISKQSADRIKQILGHKAKNIFITKNLEIEDINDKLMNSKQLAHKYNLNLKQPWALFVLHPAPLADIPLSQQINVTLQALSKRLKIQIIAILPNTDTGSEIFLNAIKKSRAFTRLFASLPRLDYLSFLATSQVLIGNSSSFVLEAPYYDTPVVNIGRRQENRVKYDLMKNVEYNTQEIYQAIQTIVTQRYKKSPPKIPSPGASKIISEKIKDFLNS